MDVWTHVRRFLIFWAVAFGALLVISIVVYWSDLSSALATSVQSGFEAIVTIVIVIAVIIFIIRSIL